MIIVQLKGGLGNQLFQYAAGLSLALHHGVELKVDITELKRPDDIIGTMRHFDLQALAEPPQVASDKEISDFIDKKLSATFEKILPPYKRKIYKEESFSYDPHFFQAGPHIYLKGYRQSEKYFKKYEHVIREKFKFKNDITAPLQPFAQTIHETNSVAIHIRRGDYSEKIVQDYHGVLDEVYFKDAVAEVKRLVGNPTFYIFSDNIEWVQQHLHIENSSIVSGNVTKSHYEDLFLMSQCHHNIIANSSFSWWGAYLNLNADKIVIVPKKWFNIADNSTADLFPDGWKAL